MFKVGTMLKASEVRLSRKKPPYHPALIPGTSTFSSEAAPPTRAGERSISDIRAQSNAKPAVLRSNRRPPLAEFVRARDGRRVTMKTPIKAKARTNVRAFGKLKGVEMPRGLQSGRLTRPLRAALPEAPGPRGPSE